MSDQASKLAGHRFPKGVSGNPGGRPKGLERRVRDLLGNDIDAIVYVQRCVSLGVPPEADKLIALGVELTPRQVEALARTFATISRRDVNEAAKLLSDRGWGKARQVVEVEDKTGPALDFAGLTDAQLDALAALDAEIDGEDPDPDDDPGAPS